MPPRRVPCVGAVVRDRADRLLLVRRGTEPERGRWSVPGGRVEPGETGPEAAAREVHEETGLQVVVGQLVGTVERDGPDGVVYVIDDYEARPLGAGEDLRAGDDADEARWFTAEEVGALDCVSGLVETLRGWDVLPR